MLTTLGSARSLDIILARVTESLYSPTVSSSLSHFGDQFCKFRIILFLYRKASLALLRKMVHYITPSLLDELCSQDGATVNFGSQLVEVLSVVLDNEVLLLLFMSLAHFCSSSILCPRIATG